MARDVSQEQRLISQLQNACAGFDINVTENVLSLTSTLDVLATDLARSEDLRAQVGLVDSVWVHVRKLWRDLVRAQLTFWDGDDSDDDDEEDKERSKQKGLRALCAAVARFTRNLVAGVEMNQGRAFENEPDLRRLLHYYTSWTSREDEGAMLVARVLAQTLSNLVTGNDMLMTKLWDIYLNLPEDQVILIRLLQSSDSRTLLAVFHLISNCVHKSRTRAKMLTRMPIGARICVLLLDNMVSLHDAEEGSDGGRAFDIAYGIFTRLLEAGLVPDLYVKLSMQDEIIVPHQTTLLKLIDSYLQSTTLTSGNTSPKTGKAHVKLSPMLGNCFFDMSKYARKAIRRALGHNASSPSYDTPDFPVTPDSVELKSPQLSPEYPAELDVMLPKVCEALVLVTQCIITITLEAEAAFPGESTGKSSADDSATSAASATDSERNLKVYFNEKRSENRGAVECLVELLRLLDVFLPRINFGKPVAPARGQGFSTEGPLAAPAAAAPQSVSPTVADTGFNYLKRDLVRLLGILCHNTKAVQDRVRECGGIEVVMNLCVIDERNPFLREHAIFTLHNLLQGNPANQAVVDEVKPTGQWDESGVLRDTPGAIRK